jgi:hypothetical protein
LSTTRSRSPDTTWARPVLDRHGGGAHQLPLAHEGVRPRQAQPRVLLEPHAGPRHLRDVVDEVAGEHQTERLRLADRLAVLGGVGEDRVLHGVGRQDLGVVAGEVGVREVAGQRDADVQVDELVRVAVAVHTHDARLGLAVLAVPQQVCHRCQLPR